MVLLRTAMRFSQLFYFMERHYVVIDALSLLQSHLVRHKSVVHSMAFRVTGHITVIHIWARETLAHGSVEDRSIRKGFK